MFLQAQAHCLYQMMSIVFAGKANERRENEELLRNDSGNSSNEEDINDDRPNTPLKKVIEPIEYVNGIQIEEILPV